MEVNNSLDNQNFSLSVVYCQVDVCDGLFPHQDAS
jgi:hypothetical protein